MKTILTRMKTLIQNNDDPNVAQTLGYVRFVEIVHPELALLKISKSLLPSVFLTPIGTSEEWEASQRKKATHLVSAYLVMEYDQRELSLIGDSTRPQGKGILDFVNDFLTVFRSHRLAVNDVLYLDKPLDILAIDYYQTDLSEDAFFIIAKIDMQCTRLLLESSIPTNI